MSAQKGDIVEIHYTVTFKNGKIYDTTRNKDPLVFKLGEVDLIPGLEGAIIGMEEGQQKRLTIPANKAFGPKSDELIVTINRKNIPEGVTPKEGKHVEITRENGEKLNALITEVTEETVTLDGNPIQAGEEFVASIELLNIISY